MSQQKPGTLHIGRADEFDKAHGRLHLSRAIFAEPDPLEEEPNLIAYVEGEENAKLFAAAGKMLTALRAVHRCAVVKDGINGQLMWLTHQSVIDMVRDAIAEAVPN